MFKLFKKEIQEEDKEKYITPNIFYNTDILDKKSYLREIEFINKPNIKLDLLEEDNKEIKEKILELSKQGISHHFLNDKEIELVFNSGIKGKIFYIYTNNEINYEELYEEEFKVNKLERFYKFSLPLSEEQIRTFLFTNVYYYSGDLPLLENPFEEEVINYFNKMSQDKLDFLREIKIKKSQSTKDFIIDNLNKKTSLTKEFLDTFRDALTLEDMGLKIQEYNNEIEKIKSNY